LSVIEIYRERLPFHPLLGRHVLLDSRSKDYAVQPDGVTPIVSKRHPQSISILDQGQTGECTGDSSTSCAYHDPFFTPGMTNWRYTPDQSGARAWYHENTVEDGYPGTWNVDGTGQDTGSDGLTASKVAEEAGIISGYQAALDLDSSLQALMKTPGITGIPWYNSMFDAPASGLLTVTASSGLAGGHELCTDEVVAADAPSNGTGVLLVGGPNSWGPSWGDTGRWYMKASDWWSLRQQNGDVYFWVPKAQPGPAPIDQTDDQILWSVAKPFTQERHAITSYKRLASTLLSWAAKKDFL